MMFDTAMLLGLAWKSAAVAGLTLALLRIARARSAGERSMIAHAGLFALLALPAAALLLPTWAPLPASWFPEAAMASPAVFEGGSATAEAAAAAAAAARAASASAAGPIALPDAVPPAASWSLPALSDLAMWTYAIPLALLFGLVLVAVVRLFAMRGRAEVLVEASWLSALAEAQRRMGFKHGTALLVSDELRSPISWGVLRPTIVLSHNAVAATGEAEAIIAHELAHVARLDWAKLLAARIACALFWFNPLVWMLARESHQLREEAADDAVLMADIDGPDYATLLVGAARHDNKGALLAAHGVAPGKGSLRRRVTRVLDASLKRGPASATWIAMSVGFLAGVTLPLAAFSATAAMREDPVSERGGQPLAAVAPVAAPQSAAAVGDPAGAAASAAAADADAGASTGKLPVDQLITMRAVGITPDDVRRTREAGEMIDADDMVAAKATGTDPAYIHAMRRIIPGTDIEELIGARSVGVTPDYARSMRGVLPGATIDDMIAMRATGVDADYVREMRRAGVRISDADDAIELHATGMWRGGAHKRAVPNPPEAPEPPEPPEAPEPPGD